MLIRKDYKLREDQIAFLDSLPGSASEHVRAAIDDYMKKKKPQAMESASKPLKVFYRGEEVEDGREF